MYSSLWLYRPPFSNRFIAFHPCRSSYHYEVTHLSTYFLYFFIKIDTLANLNTKFSQHLVNKCWLKCWPMKSSWCKDHFQYLWFSHRTKSYFYILHWKWKCWNPRFQHFHFFWKTELRRYWIGRCFSTWNSAFSKHLNNAQ